MAHRHLGRARSRWWTALAVAVAVVCVGLMPRPAAAAGDDADLTASAVSQKTRVHAGDEFAIAVVLEFQPGWHIWPNKPVLPKGLEDLFADPTTLTLVSSSKGVKVGDHQVQWPAAKKVPAGALAEKPVDLLAYTGRVVIYVPVSIQAGAAPGAARVELKLHYQACNEETCHQPTDVPVEATFEIVAPGAETADSGQADLFAAYKPGATPPVDGATPPPPGPAPQLAAAPAAPRTIFGFQIGSGVLFVFLFSAIGGAILNLTPCVLPVIPIKIMTLVQHAGSRRRRIVLGSWMALGVVAFWFAIGLPMALVNATLDPSRLIFGTWWVTLSLGMIIAVMGLGIMGLFVISLPQSVYMVNTKADSPSGSFLFGVMTAVLGLPCFGFVAGGLLAGAATLPPAVIMLTFLGLGVGMAVPYLVLAIWPKLVESIPRTGPASELVKQVMGLLLLAAAAYFIAAGVKTLLLDKPHLKDAMGWWAAAFFTVLAGLWLTVRTLQISKKAWPRVVMPAISVAASAVAILFAAGLSKPGWLPFDRAAIEQAKSQGKIVVLDFTADWCINCKVLKRTVLDRDPVRARLDMKDVVRFEVDLSSNSAPGWAYLNDELKRSNVPTLMIAGPGVSEPIIYNAYTPTKVLEAIEKAKGPVVASTVVVPTTTGRP